MSIKVVLSHDSWAITIILSSKVSLGSELPAELQLHFIIRNFASFRKIEVLDQLHSCVVCWFYTVFTDKFKIYKFGYFMFHVEKMIRWCEFFIMVKLCFWNIVVSTFRSFALLQLWWFWFVCPSVPLSETTFCLVLHAI